MLKAQGKMVEISTQQIISCDTTDDYCNGGYGGCGDYYGYYLRK